MSPKYCEGKDHHFNPASLDGNCIECGGADPKGREALHTPLPWSLGQKKDTQNALYDISGLLVADCQTDRARNKEEEKANAAFIRLAVDMYDASRDALRDLTIAFGTWGGEVHPEMKKKALAKAKEVLQKMGIEL